MAILAAGLVAGVAFLCPGRAPGNEPVGDGVVQGGSGARVLVGYLRAPGVVDPTRFSARCCPMRLEPNPVVHAADLDARGRFVLTGLTEQDYCVEIVLRANPALVLAREDFVRPGGDELVIQADPAQLFGASTSEDRQ